MALASEPIFGLGLEGSGFGLIYVALILASRRLRLGLPVCGVALNPFSIKSLNYAL